MNILISGIGGPTPQSIARSLKIGKFGSKVKLFGTDVNPLSYGLYDNDLYEATKVIPYAEGEGYWGAIEEMIEKYDITYAMVHPEKEVITWSKRQTEGKSMPCKVIIPDLSLINSLVDKGNMSELLKGTNFIPLTLSLDPLKLNFDEILKTLTPPFWVRSSTGSSGLGSLKIHNNSELNNWISINPNVESFIASSYLPGRNLACKLLYFNGELIRSATGERVNYIMSKVAPSGITGNTSYGRLINDSNIVDISVAALTLLSEKTKSIKHGIFTVDLKEDENGTPFVTEINIRMVAFNYCFAKAGANFSDDILQLMSEGEIDRSFINYTFKEGTIFLRDVDSTPMLLNENDLK